MKKVDKNTKSAVKEKPSQGGRVMRQERQKESVAKAQKYGLEGSSSKGTKKGY